MEPLAPLPIIVSLSPTSLTVASFPVLQANHTEPTTFLSFGLLPFNLSILLISRSRARQHPWSISLCDFLVRLLAIYVASYMQSSTNIYLRPYGGWHIYRDKPGLFLRCNRRVLPSCHWGSSIERIFHREGPLLQKVVSGSERKRFLKNKRTPTPWLLMKLWLPSWRLSSTFYLYEFRINIERWIHRVQAIRQQVLVSKFIRTRLKLWALAFVGLL